MPQERKFLWLDFETTGLKSYQHVPLEVAAVVTDHALNPLDSYWAPIIAGDEELAKMDSWCKNIHKNSGLLEDCVTKGLPITEVQRDLVAMVKRNFSQKAVLAGNSVHFDLGFIEFHFPELRKLITHQVVDVTSYLQGYRISHGLDLPPPTHVAHRSSLDILQSIETYQKLISMVRLPGQSRPENAVLDEALELLREIVVTPVEEAVLGPTENTVIERPYWLHQKIKDFLKRNG